MTEIPCAEQQGWQGILAALERAQAGDIVRLAPATFSGEAPLRVPGGVTLTGHADSLLVFHGDGPALLVEDAKKARVMDLNIRFQTRNCTLRRHPESLPHDEIGEKDSVRIEWGMVHVAKSLDVQLERLTVTAEGQPANGLCIVNNDRVEVRECRINAAGASGLCFVSSRDCVASGNACWGNGLAGILLQRGSDNPDAPSTATLTGNRCHDNTQAGILLFSSEAPKIDGNECWGNSRSGIVLQRDPNNPGDPSTATLTGNRCHDNTLSGIVLISSEAPRIDGNECWGNSLSGIVLQRDPDNPGDPSTATLTGNRCHDNTEFGIALFSSEAPRIDGNECWGNSLSGIVLQGDPNNPGAPSTATLTGNRCHDNTQSGIVLISSEAPRIDGNECWGNSLSGIVLQRDPDNPGDPSTATLTGNRCHDNTEFGIALFSSEAPRIDGNECWGNAFNHIVEKTISDLPQHACVVTELSHMEAPPKPVEDLAVDRLRQVPGGFMAIDLFHEGLEKAEHMAAFMGGEGCVGCLGRFWNEKEKAEDKPADAGLPDNDSADVRSDAPQNADPILDRAGRGRPNDRDQAESVRAAAVRPR